MTSVIWEGRRLGNDEMCHTPYTIPPQDTESTIERLINVLAGHLQEVIRLLDPVAYAEGSFFVRMIVLMVWCLAQTQLTCDQRHSLGMLHILYVLRTPLRLHDSITPDSYTLCLM